ncbi:MAG: SHOCT domain-containing protein [Desulfobacterales bacterium]
METLQLVYHFGWNQWMPMWNHWGPGMMGWGIGGGGWLGGIFMLVWWIVVIAALVALFRWLSTSRRSASACSSSSESALDIAKKRYARGEIDQEQYLALKRELES